MDAHLAQWLNLVLRWIHVVTGAAWIGTSFYFNWLNSRLAPPARPEAGVGGELWAVHGGGFYRVVKYAVGPEHLPGTLHWFKWEAYATWLSGIALLVFVYYLGAAAYLIDPQVARLDTTAAIAVGVGTLVAAWLVYDALCRSPLGRVPLVLATVLFALGTALAWGLAQLLSPRAAYIHVGAALGTIMAANVFRVIIPSQRDMVAALAQARAPDSRLGEQAALRSLHNNYLTLPVLFIMVSGHYPATYGHRLSWLILAGLTLVGVATRHWFNLRNQGRGLPNAWLLPGAAVAVAALAVVTAPPGGADGRAAVGSRAADAASFADVRVIVARRCAPCHSAAPTVPGIAAAPSGVALDTPQEIRAGAERILAVAVQTRTMPLGNVTGMTDEERELVRHWIRAGAKLR
ncbi:MAG TPA: urate hydroxylase PuuD [Gemmatimonadales bacterium]|nr:urate hydroxylase PuuD [Gemmatimonadales bacterium]